MCSFKSELSVAVCMAIGVFASWAVGLEPGPVDLSAISEPGLRGFFNKIEPGTKDIDGIPFDIKDARVRLRPGEKRRTDFAPVTAAGIHFLHFTENAGDRIGAYTLVYADGKRVEIPLRGGLNIHDWWKPGTLAFGALVHSDSFMNGAQQQPIGFWRFSVQNPHPDSPLTALEFANSDTAVTINLIAVTFRAACGDKVGDVPVWVVGMDEEQFFLAVLKQPAAVAGKEKACEQLKRVGTLKSVPALAACLTDPKLSHAARLALAAMSYPEARAALRDALDATTGAVKAGIVETLGVLRAPEYAPLLAPLLRDKDPVIAMSAALALGRIGGPAAVDALKMAVQDGSGRFRMAALDSLLRCAEALCGKDDGAAHALYTDIFNQWGRGYVGAAAYQGMIRTGGEKAQELISAALLGDNPALWDAALPSVREIGGPGITRACGDLLGRVPRTVLPGLIEALAQRGDRTAARALVPLVDDADPAISAAAIKALALVGDGSTVAVLVKAAAYGEEPNRSAAMQALVQGSAPGVPEALLARLEGADTAETAVVANVFGQRGDDAVGPALRQLLQRQDASVRMAAVQALAEVGVAADTELLCQVAERAESEDERLAAKRALIVLGKRIGTPAAFVDSILASLNKENVALRCAMLGVCGSLRNEKFLQALDNATRDAAAEVKDAAIRALAESDNPEALAYLWNLSNTTSDLTYRVFAFRGIARLASREEVDEKVREDVLTRALAMAERPEEKKLFLQALSGCHTIGALGTIARYLPFDDVVAEAVMAWGQNAKVLLPAYPDEIRDSAPGVVARAQEAGLSKEAVHALTDVTRALAAVPAPGSQVRFEHVVVDRQFRSEGVAVADVNGDGENDILAGDLWYEAPDWQAHEVRSPQTYDPNTGYSQCFANFAADVDEDGWTDSIVIGFPGAPAHWYRNPGGGTGHWQEYLLAAAACGETPIYGDLLGDGKPVPVFAMNNRITWFRTGQDKLAPWLAFPISHQVDAFAQFGHGLGMGDVNNDGRIDILCPEGWWEGPEDRTRPDWGFHAAHLGPACANMVVYDVDGDGDNDVISSSAHEYGLWWFEQRQEKNETLFDQHEIYKGISQTHALILADVNNDGLQDLITGKRYYAHCGHDPGCDEPAMLCWFELQRPEPGKAEYRMHEIDNDSGVGTQFEVCDFDGDGLQDVVSSNKKGVHVFLQRRSK